MNKITPAHNPHFSSSRQKPISPKDRGEWRERAPSAAAGAVVAARQRLGVRLQKRHLLQAVGQQRQHRPRHQQRRARRQFQRGARLALRRSVAGKLIKFRRGF